MMGGRDNSHYINPWPVGDSIVGRFIVSNVELCQMLYGFPQTGNVIVPDEYAFLPSNS